MCSVTPSELEAFSHSAAQRERQGCGTVKTRLNSTIHMTTHFLQLHWTPALTCSLFHRNPSVSASQNWYQTLPLGVFCIIFACPGSGVRQTQNKIKKSNNFTVALPIVDRKLGGSTYRWQKVLCFAVFCQYKKTWYSFSYSYIRWATYSLL